jgi:hypothetical protein
MRIFAALLAFAALSPVAHAQTEAAAARPGQVVRMSSGAKVGQIDRVNTDGSVRIIYGERFVTLPADSIKSEGGLVTTSLVRKDINKLRN